MIMITNASCKHNDHDISTFILNRASNYKGRSDLRKSSLESCKFSIFIMASKTIIREDPYANTYKL